MKLISLLLILAVGVFFISSALATPAGKSVEYAGGAMGKVIFDGKTHADKGAKCNDCHTKLFQMKKEAKMTMADHKSDKYCFNCHNGSKAFGSDNHCAKCHKK
ncbi:MAG TPA: hypothetical protein HPP56_06535 [Nitrospirae bacterium]|nr:hypothetical protein [Nitrospirota bacterium]